MAPCGSASRTSGRSCSAARRRSSSPSGPARRWAASSGSGTCPSPRRSSTRRTAGSRRSRTRRRRCPASASRRRVTTCPCRCSSRARSRSARWSRSTTCCPAARRPRPSSLPPPSGCSPETSRRAARARHLGARRPLLSRPGARLPRPRDAPGLPARLRRGGDALPRLLRAARRCARRGRGDALRLRVPPRGRRGGARGARRGAPGSGGHLLALLFRGGAPAAAAAALRLRGPCGRATLRLRDACGAATLRANGQGNMTRRITIDPITRLEGHGRIEVLLDEQGNAQSAFLQVPELRGFERFCVGRAAEEMPQLTAHVCGVCPAAHHIASVRALDALYRATPPVAARRIQALYYNLFLFEDHLLHYWYLGGPDFYVGPRAPAPMRNVLGVVARVGRELGGRIVAVRKEARDLMAAIAGRTIHPVFALPGGISRPLGEETIRRVREAAPRFVRFAEDTLESFRGAVLEDRTYAEVIESEVFRVRCHSMGMVDEAGRLTFLDGRLRIVDAAGAEVALFDPADWLDHIAERVEPWTYAKLTFLKARGWKE